MRNFHETALYCLNCGNQSMPIYRKDSKRKEKFHRKKLYCWHCKQEVNHIECRTLEEKNEFKENFEKGLYIDEALQSMEVIKNECLPCI